MTKESLERAVARLKSGDMSAFDCIYDGTSKVVFFVVHNIVRRREVAEDIVQDTYVSALGHLDSYSSDNFLAWLTTIAKRKALNAAKRASREKATDFQTDGEKLGVTHLPDDEAADLISIAENALSKEDFQIVVMCAVAGYKRREVAKMLDMPISTVSYRYKAALDKLKRIVNGDENEKD